MVPPMVKAARKATMNKAQPGRRHRLVRIYTAWHPVLVVLLEHVLPGGFYQCISEFQLSREPLRIDVVVVRRSRPGTPPAPRLLASVVRDLADHTLVHFKGPWLPCSRAEMSTVKQGEASTAYPFRGSRPRSPSTTARISC
jgi:hypothetical protein